MKVLAALVLSLAVMQVNYLLFCGLGKLRRGFTILLKFYFFVVAVLNF